MKGKLKLLTGGAVGYVLGTKAGRERYEQIRSQAQTLWNHPKVQEQATKAKEKAPLLKEKAADAASSSSSSSSPSSTGYSSTPPSSPTAGADPLVGGDMATPYPSSESPSTTL